MQLIHLHFSEQVVLEAAGEGELSLIVIDGGNKTCRGRCPPLNSNDNPFFLFVALNTPHSTQTTILSFCFFFSIPSAQLKRCSFFLLPSSQTGQPMEQLSLVPNLNLRRLIKDLLAEGGEGLYVYRVDSDEEGDGSGGSSRAQGGGRRDRGREKEGIRDYRFALVTEQILVLKVRVHATTNLEDARSLCVSFPPL